MTQNDLRELSNLNGDYHHVSSSLFQCIFDALRRKGRRECQDLAELWLLVGCASGHRDKDLPVATVSVDTASHVIMQWENETITESLITLYSGNPYSLSVMKDDGNVGKRAFFFKTFGAVLNCDGGVLKIGQKRYRTQSQQPTINKQQGIYHFRI